jgi:hypothetical protein
MTIAQLGHLGELAIAASLASHTSDSERARQALRVENFVSDALTRAAIDDILSALTSG